MCSSESYTLYNFSRLSLSLFVLRYNLLKRSSLIGSRAYQVSMTLEQNRFSPSELVNLKFSMDVTCIYSLSSDMIEYPPKREYVQTNLDILSEQSLPPSVTTYTSIEDVNSLLEYANR